LTSPLYGRDLLSVNDLSPHEIQLVLDVARDFKRRYYAGERQLPLLQGKTIALIFEKPSTRTRVSMEVAALQLAATPLSFNRNDLQLGRGEPVKDTARVLSRYVDAIAARVYRHDTLVELAAYSTVPVINLLSDLEHPLQALADIMTIMEFKDVRRAKIAYLGDARNNVAHSLLLAVAKTGGHIVLASPPQLAPRQDILEAARTTASVTGATIELTEDPYEAARGADVVYTDVWVSMGEEEKAEEKKRMLKGYQVNEKLMELTANDSIFMHCLPAHRGEEVTEEVLEGSRSVVWQQAENRLHVQKAVLALILSG